jgi:hypothetical protein
MEGVAGQRADKRVIALLVRRDEGDGVRLLRIHHAGVKKHIWAVGHPAFFHGIGPQRPGLLRHFQRLVLAGREDEQIVLHLVGVAQREAHCRAGLHLKLLDVELQQAVQGPDFYLLHVGGARGQRVADDQGEGNSGQRRGTVMPNAAGENRREMK